MDKKTAHQILSSRVLISEAGKYTVKVTSVHPYINPETNVASTIVNFAAMTPFNASQAIKAFKEGDFEASVGKGTALSSSQLSGMFIPQKGETVDIEVTTIMNKEDVEILVVSSIIPRKAIQAKKFSLELEEVEEPEIV